MDDLSQVNRPVTLAEIAAVAGLPIATLRRLLRRHGIGPGCRIGRLELYGPREVRAIFAALGVTVAVD